jgi:hypothetical protein
MKHSIIPPPSLVRPINGVKKFLDQIPRKSPGWMFSLIDPGCINLGGRGRKLPLAVTELNNHQLKLVGSYYGLEVRIRVG